jgi:hypothetical protein
MATFGTLVGRLQDHFSTGSGSAARYLLFLQEWHRRLLQAPGADLYRQRTLSMTYGSGLVSVTLPSAFSRLDHLVSITDNLPLTEKSLGWWRSIPPTSMAAGTPFAYIVLGLRPTAVDPAATGKPTYVVSSAVGDTTQVATIRALLLDGTVAQANATLTGTARVQVGTWTTAINILGFFLQTVATGTVTLYDAAAAGNVLGTIPASRYDLLRTAIALVPTPSGDRTLQVDGQLALDAPMTTTDRPWIPEEWEHVLEMGARLNEYEKQDDDRYAALQRALAAEEKKFRWFCVNRPDYRPTPGMTNPVQTTSNLGPYYPAGRW